MAKKLSLNEFIQKANKIHNNKYDYTYTTYINTRTKIDIVCPIHGRFSQRPSTHLSGHGCNNCGIKSQKNKMSHSIETFIQKANEIHNNKYDYSHIIHYVNSEIKVPIECHTHGIFYQKPHLHLMGHGCAKCAVNNQYKTTIDFIQKATIIHNNKYDYSKSHYTHSHNLITIICPIHGEFKQMTSVHLRGSGCRKCNCSKGELTITKWLDDNNVYYIKEYTFHDCKHIRVLPFDFYIPSLNMCIEYDGEQHFVIRSNTWNKNNALEKIQLRDSIKTQYCVDNNINLIRIPYTEFNNIYHILEDNVKNTK